MIIAPLDIIIILNKSHNFALLRLNLFTPLNSYAFVSMTSSFLMFTIVSEFSILSNSTVILSLFSVEYLPLLWKPDLFFTMGLESYRHESTTPNVFLRLWSNGSVLYSQRLSYTLAAVNSPRRKLKKKKNS